MAIFGQRRHNQRSTKKTSGEMRVSLANKLRQAIPRRGTHGLRQQIETKHHRIRGLRFDRQSPIVVDVLALERLAYLVRELA